jgi:uncharacterized protein YwgA
MMNLTKKDGQKIAGVVRDAGGQIVGRTKLQKLCFLLEAAGLGDGFSFEYRHYGPYSEEVAGAAHIANVTGTVLETEQQANWGGRYSIFTTNLAEDSSVPEARKELARLAANADSIQLELAATALFLALEGVRNAWAETARRKPEKAEGRLDRAKELYRRIKNIKTPDAFPDFD